MNSIWSSAAAQAGASPLNSLGTAPTPGGAAAKFQSILQAAGKHGQAGLNPKAHSAAGGASPMASSNGSGSPSDSDATISANDFLTLLVTEMQNQDPTAGTDPNEYIDQLVQVNSLEQLISINQNLATVLDSASSTPPATGSTATSRVTAATASVAAARNTSGMQAPGGAGSRSAVSAIQSAGASSRPATVHGNLSAPGAAPAARTVAHALDGHARAAPHGHAIRDIRTRPLP